MQTKKQSINAQLFVVTVLSACLGLMIVSVPTYGQSSEVKVGCSERKESLSEFLNDDIKKGFDNALFEAKDLANIRDFFSALAKSSANGEINLTLPIELNAITKDIDETTRETTLQYEGYLQPKLTEIIIELLSNLSSSSLRNHSIDNDEKTIPLYLYLKVDSDSLESSLKSGRKTKEHSNELVDNYTALINKGICLEQGQLGEIVYQNTKALTKRNQVLIVTHLPRGSLNTLLVAK